MTVFKRSQVFQGLWELFSLCFVLIWIKSSEVAVGSAVKTQEEDPDRRSRRRFSPLKSSLEASVK